MTPAVRLAYHPEGGRTLAKLPDEPTPAVRLAVGLHQNRAENDALANSPGPSGRLALGNSPPERNGTSGLESPPPPSPTGRLATAEGGIAYPGGAMYRGLQDAESRPGLLVSYVYLKPFLANRHRYRYRDWVLDSGAFSAHHSGVEIRLQDYIDTCKRLRDEDPTLTEVFALDVIGDWRATLRNCEAMWAQGVEAIPCYHAGSPESVLIGIARDYPKIALGGCVGYRDKDRFAAQCFARVWPKRIHGFGFGSEKSIMALPWHSVDATNWEIGPCKFGRWNAFGGKMSVRGSKQNLRAEVEWYLDLERRARQRWAGEMSKLSEAGAPVVRLATQQANDAQIIRSGLAAESPVVRLAADPASGGGQGLSPPSVRLAYAETGRDGSPKIDKALGSGG